MKRAALALLLCLIAWTAAAQNVTTIGPVTPGDLTVYNSPTVIKDSGYSPSTIINFVCTLAPGTCSTVFGYTYAPWYGVKCDGTTDDSANLALAYAGSYDLRIQAGVCIANNLSFNVAGHKTSGVGTYATSLKATSASANVINWSGAGQTISNITVTSSFTSGTGRTGIGIFVPASPVCLSCKLDAVNITNQEFGFYGIGFPAGIIQYSYATNNLVDGFVLDAYDSAANDGNIDEVAIVQTNSNVNGGSGFNIIGGTNSVGISFIRPTAASNTTYGMILQNIVGDFGHSVRDVYILQPEISANSTGQINASTNNSALGFNIDGGGLIEGAGAGISIGPGMYGVNIGNVPIFGQSVGILLNGSGGTITGPTFTAGGTTYIELGASSSGYTLTGISGYNGTSSAPTNGLKVDAGAGAFSCVGVDFSNATNPLVGSIPAGSTVINCPSKNSDALYNGAIKGATISGASNTLSNISLGSLTGLGTGVQTALGNATNGTGGLVTFNGNIGTTATGHASLDLALTGGTMSGAIAMGGNNITGVGTIGATGAVTVGAGGFTGQAFTNQVVVSTAATTGQFAGLTLGQPGGGMGFNWNANTTAASATAQFFTIGFLNAATFDASAFSIQTLSGGALNVGTTATVSTFNGPTVVTGNFVTATGSPTIASGACGTGTNGTITGDNQSGVITVGAAATTSCAVTFSKTLANAPKSCVAFPGNAAAAGATILAHIDTISATGFTLSGSVLASTKFNFQCY